MISQLKSVTIWVTFLIIMHGSNQEKRTFLNSKANKGIILFALFYF